MHEKFHHLSESPEDALPDWRTYENELNRLVRGYPRLAGGMQDVPTTAIFRRFAALNARSLLYYQQELIYLENRLKQVEYRDSVSSKPHRKEFASNSARLHDSADLGESLQWPLMLQIREKLESYNKALVYQSIICKLPRPDQYDVQDIRHFIHCPEDVGGMGAPFPGTEAGPWGTLRNPGLAANDLITLKARVKEDKFSNFIAEKAIKYIQWPLKRFQSQKNRLNGMVIYQDKTVLKITYFIVGTFAGLAPILSILVLSRLHTIKARLWATAAFNVGIAISLQLFTEAKRMDIFAVTAAFAAVQVVFVGQTLDDSPKEMKFPKDYVLNATCNF